MEKNNENIIIDGIDERIESFLRGTMTAEEEATFKQEIRQNPGLRNRAMAMTSLIRGLQAKNRAIEKTIIQESSTRSRVRPILWWACSVAAVFAILFGAYKDHRYRMLDDAISPYYMKYSMDDISRGDVDAAVVDCLYGMFAKIQESRNVSDIIKELEPIYNSLDKDFTYHPWANDIAWNLALAYVKDDQIDKAVLILKKLGEENPDTPIYKKSQELLKKIQSL